MAIRYTSSFDKTIAFSDTCAQIALTTGVAQTYTLPGTSTHKYTVLFGLPSTASVYVGYNATPVVPLANTVTLTQGVEFITPGSQRYAIGGDVLSFISSDATAKVGISVRSIPNAK